MEHVFLQPDHLPFLELRTTLGSTLPYDAHFHAGFSVGLLVEGQTCFCLGGTPYTARKGDIVLIAPGRVHSCNPIDGRPRSYHMFFFDEAWAMREAAALALMAGEPLHPVITGPELYSEGLDLAKAIHSGTAAESMVTSFFAAVLAGAGGMAPCKEQGTVGSQSALLLPFADSAACSVAALAEKAHMRRESFSRLIRRKTGLPPRSYLHCLRVEKGRSLLRQGKSIAEAAFESGYADQSHFHRMFTRIVSATPGCYRKSRSHSYKK